MTNQLAVNELDPTPLVSTMTEKSTAGKLRWQATSDESTFIASVGGDTTLKITMEGVVDLDDFGNPHMTDEPVLILLDAKGRTLWKIPSAQVQGVESRPEAGGGHRKFSGRWALVVAGLSRGSGQFQQRRPRTARIDPPRMHVGVQRANLL